MAITRPFMQHRQRHQGAQARFAGTGAHATGLVQGVFD